MSWRATSTVWPSSYSSGYRLKNVCWAMSPTNYARPSPALRIALALAQVKPGNGPEYLQRIEREAERLEELIGQLLSTQAEDLVLDAHMDLVPLLNQLCKDANFEGQIDCKQITLTADTEEAIVASSTDLLRKCFENILRNALHHTADNSPVSVSLTSTGDNYQIVIEDQGSGCSR